MKIPQPNTLRALATLLVIGTAGVLSAHAAPLAYDSFESYTTGTNIHGQTGGTGWSGAWTVQNINGDPTGISTISGTEITYNYGGTTLGGGKSLQLSNTSNGTQRDVFSSVNTGGSDYYVSMIFQVSGGVFIGWQAKDGSVDISNDSIGLVNSSGTVGARVDNNTTNSSGTLVTAGTTYFMVIEYTGWTGTNYSTVNLWINPNTGDQSNSSISATYTDTTLLDSGGSEGFAGLYARVVPNSGQSLLLDDLRVGTDWASVTAIPEPSTYSLALAGVAALSVACNRRRRE